MGVNNIPASARCLDLLEGGLRGRPRVKRSLLVRRGVGMGVGLGAIESRAAKVLGQYSERQSVVVGVASALGAKENKEKRVKRVQKCILDGLEGGGKR